MEETKYSILVARDLGYISDGAYDSIMNDAEALSERLEALHGQLAIGAPAAQPKTAESSGAALFGVSKGVRETFGEFVSWLKGDTRKKKPEEPQVWVEEPASYNYLEDSRD
jgi:hypothetical protein